MAFNQVSSLSFGAGMPNTAGPMGNHIIVYDSTQNPPVAVAPADIQWALGPMLTAVTVTPDATGFFFSAPAGTAAQSDSAVATNPTTGQTGTLPVSVTAEGALVFSQE